MTGILRCIVLSALASVGCATTPDAPHPVEVALATPGSAPITSASGRARPPGDVLDGEYTEAHEVMVVCDEPDGCHETVADTLRVRASRGRLDVAVELVQTNGHLCAWEGTLARRPDGAWASVAPDCTVVLVVTPERFTLTSDGCREYCGARAVLDGDFPRAPRKPDAPAP